MTRALIVYESMYGTNEEIATAIVDGVRSAGAAADLVPVSEAPNAIPSDVSLLIVGGPNHATGLSTPSSRLSAAQQTDEPLVTGDRGLREWFEELQPPTAEVAAAPYDTRLAKPRFLRWLDRASRGIDKRMRSRGFRVVVNAEHFFVQSAEGPLEGGELARARRWGEALATYVTAARPVA